MIEFRSWDNDESEVRAVGDGRTFSGYAARFNSPSEWMGFEERIAPGAFTRTLKARNEIKAFLNHNMDIVLGSTRAGTLRLEQDDKGLHAEIDLPNSEWGNSVAEATRRGDISGMSFGFNVPKGGDTWSDDGLKRTLNEIALMEVSPVSGFPAYRATTASVRNLARQMATEPDALAAAVDSLLAGEKLTEPDAATLRAVINQLADPEEIIEEAAAVEARVPLSLLAKQLDLKGKF